MISKDLISVNEPESLAAESYKMFRSNLKYMKVDSEKKVVMFTSSVSEEGKTTSISNIATSFALDGKKTLLIECDLRRARVHSVFGINQSPGITNMLSEKTTLEDAVHQIKEVPLLDVLTAGPLPPSPAELLGSKALEEIVLEARSKYDMILIDAPPVLSVTDAVVLNRMVDGVVLVIAANETKKSTVHKAIAAFKKIDANMLGILISKVDMKRNDYYDYYKKGYTYTHEKPKKSKPVIEYSDN
ncbi:CpsD/CapB family tyrosine-protein kinase [Petrocella sp. FN5]|uniref:CpsD/CapB family tyrosine-protein kinase n=1 Tax=Petrocella sp. FN5 TaxID=3032002 RepID=UPI0023DC4E1A|nr:CpsD/CapB family tyrosine-protein kinase [Petrocella sp. FN5]MDF1617521.1 CpsD/CapB family tyrosine-protein kinase [Petrocella sp. FN5]